MIALAITVTGAVCALAGYALARVRGRRLCRTAAAAAQGQEIALADARRANDRLRHALDIAQAQATYWHREFERAQRPTSRI